MDTTTQDQILQYLIDEVGGDWLLAGGGLVRLSFDATRGTEDLDLVSIREGELSDSAAKQKLFRWLIDRGLGPEWVNTAVEPFVREVPEWENELVPLQSGKRGRLFRPNITLFAYLKLRRATGVDLEDIRKAVAGCPEKFDSAKLLSWADEKVRKQYLKHAVSLGLRAP